MAIVLGLDLSTQSATALVLDTAKGTTVARARAAFGADFPDRGHPEGFLRGGQGGEVHADPHFWLDGLELALDRLAKLTDLSKVDAVSVSGQQHGSANQQSMKMICRWMMLRIPPPSACVLGSYAPTAW